MNYLIYAVSILVPIAVVAFIVLVNIPKLGWKPEDHKLFDFLSAKNWKRIANEYQKSIDLDSTDSRFECDEFILNFHYGEIVVAELLDKQSKKLIHQEVNPAKPVGFLGIKLYKESQKELEAQAQSQLYEIAF